MTSNKFAVVAQTIHQPKPFGDSYVHGDAHVDDYAVMAGIANGTLAYPAAMR